jgi:hypothetical protein
MELHRQRDTLTPEQFARCKGRIINPVERLVDERYAGPGEAGKRQRRHARCFDAPFIFLERRGVEPANNSSE